MVNEKKERALYICLLLTSVLVLIAFVAAHDDNSVDANHSHDEPASNDPAVVIDQYKTEGEKYLEVRAEFFESMATSKALTVEFNELKEKLKDSTPEEKKGLVESLRVKSRLILLSQVSAILSHLEALQAKGIAPENADALSNFFGKQKTELDDENISIEKLITVSRSVNRFWEDNKSDYSSSLFEKTSDRFDSLVSLGGQFVGKMKTQVSSLKSAGKNVSVIENSVDKFVEDLNYLKQTNQSISSFYDVQDENSNSEELLSASTELLLIIHAQFRKDLAFAMAIIGAVSQVSASGSVTTETAERLEQFIEGNNPDEVPVAESTIEGAS